MATKRKAFSREERIQQIKECGQSIIDNAETIAGDFEYPIRTTITIDIPVQELPTIKAERSFYAEGMIERLEAE